MDQTRRTELETRLTYWKNLRTQMEAAQADQILNGGVKGFTLEDGTGSHKVTYHNPEELEKGIARVDRYIDNITQKLNNTSVVYMNARRY